MSNPKPPVTDMSFSASGNVVLLPCQPEDFKDFISGLLGRPQTITRFIQEPFEIDKDDVFNIHHLLKQRIERQNAGTLISFAADVSYSDGSAVTLNSIEDFMGYAEVKPLVCEGLHAHWMWLVKFSDREAPEKQDISLAFMGSSPDNESGTIVVNDISRFRPASGGVVSRVSHTDRSWGSDIDVLISNYIATKSFKIHDFKKFISKYFAVFAVALGITYSMMFIIAVSAFLSAYKDKNLEIVSSKWPKDINFTTLSQKVDYLVQKSDVGGEFSTIIIPLLYVFCLALGTWLGFLTAEKIVEKRPSYALLTPKTLELKSEVEEKRKNGFFKIIGGAAFTLIVAILSKVFAALVVTRMIG